MDLRDRESRIQSKCEVGPLSCLSIYVLYNLGEFNLPSSLK